MSYYKVVMPINKKLYSAHSHRWTEDTGLQKARTRYVRNKWTYPKKGHKQALFVFSDLSTAHRWRRYQPSLNGKSAQIYECEIGKIIADIGIESYAASYKKTKENPNLICGFSPAGAVLTDKVMITKRVE